MESGRGPRAALGRVASGGGHERTAEDEAAPRREGSGGVPGCRDARDLRGRKREAVWQSAAREEKGQGRNFKAPGK